MHIIGYYIHIHSLFLCNMYKLNSFGIGVLIWVSFAPLNNPKRLVRSASLHFENYTRSARLPPKITLLTGNLIVVFNCYLRSLGRYFNCIFLIKLLHWISIFCVIFKFHITTSIFILGMFLKATFSHKIVTFCTLLRLHQCDIYCDLCDYISVIVTTSLSY